MPIAAGVVVNFADERKVYLKEVLGNSYSIAS